MKLREYATFATFIPNSLMGTVETTTTILCSANPVLASKLIIPLVNQEDLWREHKSIVLYCSIHAKRCCAKDQEIRTRLDDGFDLVGAYPLQHFGLDLFGVIAASRYPPEK